MDGKTKRCAGRHSIQAWAARAGLHAGRVIPVFDPQPVLLTGYHVRLEPMQRAHAAAIFEASRDPEIWRWMLTPSFASVADAEQSIDVALAGQAAGHEVAWVTVRQSDGRLVGSTR